MALADPVRLAQMAKRGRIITPGFLQLADIDQRNAVAGIVHAGARRHCRNHRPHPAQRFLVFVLIVENEGEVAFGVETLLRPEAHPSELQSLMPISSAVFCLITRPSPPHYK